MTYLKTLTLPPTGEVADAARVVSWLVQPGQAYAAGQVLFELETDKSIIEIAAEEDGVLLEHCVAEGEMLEPLGVYAKAQVEGEPQEPAPDEAPPPAATSAAPAGITASAPADASAQAPAAVPADATARVPGARIPATPAARRLARENGLSLQDIPMQSRRVQVADVQAQLRTGGAPGQSPRFVLIHGIFGDASAWSGLQSQLRRQNLAVQTLELPGHGANQEDLSRLEDIVQDCATRLKNGEGGPIVLVGHSFGGLVAAHLARRADLPVRSLVLIAPAGMGTRINQDFLDGMLHARTPQALQRELKRLTAESVPLSDTQLGGMLDHIERRKATLAGICAELAHAGVQQHDLLPVLEQLTVPVTLIQGRQDAIVNWQDALDAPAQTSLHLLADAGHMPQWEKPGLVARLVVNGTNRSHAMH